MKWTSKLFTISLIQCGFIAAIVCLYLLKPPTPLTVTTTTLSNQPAPTSPAPPTSLTAATSPAAPPTSPGCIITIDGIRYDIKPFIALHQGGDIFQCNTDMSRIFHNQHTPDFLDKLIPYQLKQ